MNTAAATAFEPSFVPTVSWTEMVSHRSYLVRFAQRKLRDPLMAEDAVHDVFEAVLSGRAVFAGRAALPLARSALQTSSPSMRGIIRSSTSRSAGVASWRASACAPSPTAETS